MDDRLLVEKNSLRYKSGSDIPFTGRVISDYESGSERLRGAYTNGAMDGVWVFWHDNGKKEKECTYSNGKENGGWTEWYPNGKEKLSGTYVNGMMNGNWISWFDNGQKE